MHKAPLAKVTILGYLVLPNKHTIQIRRLKQEALKQIDQLLMQINMDKEHLHQSELKVCARNH